MPTYEYECEECGHVFERFQGINEDPIDRCPECEGRVRRLISSGGGLVFKGPGFYATDYRSGGRPKSSAGEGGGSEKASPPDGKPDSGSSGAGKGGANDGD